MNTNPKDIFRLYPPQFTARGLLYNRDRVTGSGKLLPEDLVWLPELGRFAINYQITGGLPRYHGQVAGEAAMLALHAPEALTPRWVAAGDLCRRTDTGAIMICIDGNGTAAAQWISLADGSLASGVGSLGSDVDALQAAVATLESDVAALETAVANKQDQLANAAALSRVTAVPDGPPLWDDAPWPGGGSELPWADVFAAASNGLVHHWQMAENSGSACADSVGSLGLTITSGSYTRGIDSPIGKAVAMVSSYMVSSGLGSIPIGAAARTIGVVFRAGEAPGVIVSYGDQAQNRSWLALQTSSSGGSECPYAIGCTGDPLRYTYGGPAIRDGNWHLAFIRYNGSRVLSVFMDGVQHTIYLGAALSFPSTGNFYAGAWYVGGTVGNTGTQDIGDIMVWNRALTVAEIRRLTNAFVDASA